MDYQKLVYSTEGNVAIVKLNNPSNYNALSMRSWLELAQAMKQAQDDEGICSILLCAEGTSFSSGFDMSDSLAMNSKDEFTKWQMIQNERDYIRSIWEIRKPIIAAVQGYCLGSGLELTLLADYVLAAEDAIFGETELQFSTIPQPTLIFMLGLRNAKELLLLAHRIPAQEAYRMGIVNRVVANDALQAEAMKIALRLAQMPTETMQITKTLINKAVDHQGFALFGDWFFDMLYATKNMPTKVGMEFERINAEKGMKEALAWMKERFSEK